MRKLNIIALFVIGVSVLFTFSAHAGVRVVTDVDKPFVEADSQDNVVVKVGFWGVDKAKHTDRVPLNIAIVLDKSGSMGSDQKIENAKAGAIEVVKQLNENDIFSLVVYDDTPYVAIPAQKVVDKDQIISYIQEISPGGSTALYAGIELGADEVQKNMSNEYLNRIILLSDGLANVGPSSSFEISQLGSKLGTNGIAVTTIGVGLDYNEDLMTILARESDGNSYFAKEASELPEIFAQDLGETMTYAAKDIDIDFNCIGDVKPIAVIGRSGQLASSRMQAHIDNLYGKNEKYALFEIELPAKKHGTNLLVGKINVQYVDPFSKKIVKEQREIRIGYDKNASIVTGSINKKVLKEVALTRTSQVKEQVVRFNDQGKFKDAQAALARNKLELEKAAKQCDNDKTLLEEAKKGDGILNVMGSQQKLTSFQRKSIVNEAYTQQRQQYFNSSSRSSQQ